MSVLICERLTDVISFVREVTQANNIPKSKSASYKKAQFTLKSMLKTIFPSDEVLEEYRHPDLVTPEGFNNELDFYYPQLNLAIEYQGEQHYKTFSFLHNNASLEQRQSVDINKINLCKEKGITLIHIPYWWDRRRESLLATVYSHRPDLFTEPPTQSEPIPLKQPSIASTTKSKSTNEIKEKLMTATLWEESMDPTGWLLTEKFDGIRMFWNGTSFFSRQGNKIPVPEFLHKQMPKIALDGELWTQYGLYQESVFLSRTKSQTDMKKWEKATFWIFDAPDQQNLNFEKRFEYLQDCENKGMFPSFVKLINAVKCEGQAHLKEYFSSIIKKGGEGVVLRNPDSMYQPGRSPNLRKYKEYFDAEVKVLENCYPHGFNCVQNNGKKLFVGINENFNEAKTIKKGTIITVKHLGENAYGTYQFPKFYRERIEFSK